MNFPSHLTFGIFTGLLTYYFTNNIAASILVLIVQIALILDFLFKKAIDFEPLHSILAMVIITLITYKFWPQYHLFVFAAYFTHLFLDIFVHEEIPLLFPFKKQIMYPIKNSEKFVIKTSSILSVIMLAIIIFL